MHGNNGLNVYTMYHQPYALAYTLITGHFSGGCQDTEQRIPIHDGNSLEQDLNHKRAIAERVALLVMFPDRDLWVTAPAPSRGGGN